MNRTETVEHLTRLRIARMQWGKARTEFQASYETMLTRLLFEAAANLMSPNEVATLLAITPARVRKAMRERGLDGRSKTLLSKQAAAALLENATLLGIEPNEIDLMSPLAYLPMGSQMRRELQDQAVSKVTEVSGNDESVSEGTWCTNCHFVEDADECPEGFGQCQACGCSPLDHVLVKVVRA